MRNAIFQPKNRLSIIVISRWFSTLRDLFSPTYTHATVTPPQPSLSRFTQTADIEHRDLQINSFTTSICRFLLRLTIIFLVCHGATARARCCCQLILQHRQQTHPINLAGWKVYSTCAQRARWRLALVSNKSYRGEINGPEAARTEKHPTLSLGRRRQTLLGRE